MLLDLMMPVMNGWQFLDEQRRDPDRAGVSVVVITANGSFDRDAIAAAEVLRKLLGLDALLEIVARYCDG